MKKFLLILGVLLFAAAAVYARRVVLQPFNSPLGNWPVHGTDGYKPQSWEWNGWWASKLDYRSTVSQLIQQVNSGTTDEINLPVPTRGCGIARRWAPRRKRSRRAMRQHSASRFSSPMNMAMRRPTISRWRQKPGTINTSPSYPITANNQAVSVQCDGISNWVVYNYNVITAAQLLAVLGNPIPCAILPPLGGDLSSSVGSCSPTVIGLQGRSVSAITPTGMQVLSWESCHSQVDAHGKLAAASPCSAFGTASGTCAEGNDARLGAGAVTGAIKSDGSKKELGRRPRPISAILRGWPGSGRRRHGPSPSGTNTTTPTIATTTFTPDFRGQNVRIAFPATTCSCTIANPASIVAGQSGMFELVQGATSASPNPTWGTEYLYVGGSSSIVLSTGLGAVDYIPYYVESTGTHIVLGGIIKGPTH